MLFVSLFSKEGLCYCLHNRSFQKSNKKSDRSFALLKRATKRVITQSLFQKEQKWAIFQIPHFLLKTKPLLIVKRG